MTSELSKMFYGFIEGGTADWAVAGGAGVSVPSTLAAHWAARVKLSHPRQLPNPPGQVANLLETRALLCSAEVFYIFR